MKRILGFFKESYANDRTAFYAEILETTILIIASAILSFTILDPATELFVPLYLVGSLLAVFSTYRRGSSAIVLCVWFTLMNTWAFMQLFVL